MAARGQKRIDPQQKNWQDKPRGVPKKWRDALTHFAETARSVRIYYRNSTTDAWLDSEVDLSVEPLPIEIDGSTIMHLRDTATREFWTPDQLAAELWSQVWLEYVERREGSHNELLRMGSKLVLCDSENSELVCPTYDVFPERDKDGRATGRASIVDRGDDEEGDAKGNSMANIERREFMRTQKSLLESVQRLAKALEASAMEKVQAFTNLHEQQMAVLDARDHVHQTAMRIQEGQLDQRADEIAHEQAWSRFDQYIAPLMPTFAEAFAQRWGVDLGSSPPGGTSAACDVAAQLLDEITPEQWESAVSKGGEAMEDLRSALEQHAQKDDAHLLEAVRAVLPGVANLGPVAIEIGASLSPRARDLLAQLQKLATS
jgi:hypothetical protein